jgi:hypothetical protein
MLLILKVLLIYTRNLRYRNNYCPNPAYDRSGDFGSGPLYPATLLFKLIAYK